MPWSLFCTLPLALLPGKLVVPAPRCASPRMDVLGQGKSWVVATKPAGVTVHEGDDCLVKQLAGEVEGPLLPVHRLDRETSGIVILARSPAAAASLQVSLASPTTSKSYLGVVCGAPEKRRGRWSKRISNKAEGRRNPQGVSSDRVDAATDYTHLGERASPRLALLGLRLTLGGRTHQVRKHAAVAGCPVLGDARYGDKKRSSGAATRVGFEAGRMALHAAALTIELDGAEMSFFAPPPAAWDPLLREMRGGEGEAIGPEELERLVTAASAGPAGGPALPRGKVPDRQAASADATASAGAGGAVARVGAVVAGSCLRWNGRKGYGWIGRADGGPDVYVHQRSVAKAGHRSLSPGEAVEFEVEAMGDGRVQAVRVTGPGGAPVVGQTGRAGPTAGVATSDTDDDDDVDLSRTPRGRAALERFAALKASKARAAP